MENVKNRLVARDACFRDYRVLGNNVSENMSALGLLMVVVLKDFKEPSKLTDNTSIALVDGFPDCEHRASTIKSDVTPIAPTASRPEKRLMYVALTSTGFSVNDAVITPGEVPAP